MDKLTQAIVDLALDTENPEKNYTLALLYEEIGQTASAINYFYRAAERTQDKQLSYECLLKSALCYERQGNRNNTVKRILQHTLYLLPKRPEAYFLMSRLSERTKAYYEGYMFASMGLDLCDCNLPPLRSSVEYPGEYGLIFEKAVCAWWWGKNMESRRLFRYLAERYEMDAIHTDSVYNNIVNLGIGPEEVTHKKYIPEMWSKLRHQFPGSGSIKKAHGQAYQDLFVLSCLDGKRDGRYLEIGSAGPYYGNNTALLEEDFGWAGVGVDFDENFVKEYRSKRKNPIIHANALEIDYDSVLSQLAVNGVVDYLQLDCEPSAITYEIMTKIPFDKYKFAVITYEHDHYQDRTKSYRKKSREFLSSRGYELVVSDVSCEGNSSFEDWYVHPDLIDRKIIDKMKDVIEGDYTTDIRTIDDYMFPPVKLEGFDNFDWGTLSQNKWFLDILHEEFREKGVYQRLFEVEKDDVVFDVGTSAGPFVHSIIKNQPKEIHCFEPESNLFNTLSKNVSQYKDVNIKLNNLAISPADGNFTTQNLYNPNEIEPNSAPAVTVNGISFKTYIEQNNIKQIDFLKLDCEGGEYDILNDANMDWILNNVRKIAGEWHLVGAEQKAKFTHFKNTYLKKFKNFKIYAMQGYEITKALWEPNDYFDKTWQFFTVYIDNREEVAKSSVQEITLPVYSIKVKGAKKEYWRRTQWPTLEITTNIAKKGCVVDCVFCPQRILEKSYNDDKRIMTLDEFKFFIDKVPREVRITFAGFTEPWLNKYATDMLLYANERGHPISAFTTGVGMSPEDVERLADVPFVGNPNGGFCLHLPDQEQYAKHPINAKYIKTIEKFKELQPRIRNFYTMCMSDNVHEAVRYIYPTASVPTFWNRAGNLVGEASLKPELDKLRGKWVSAPVSEDPRTCGCVEDLYHNVLLPNGAVSLCCMDYSLEYIIGNLNTQEYDDIVPVPNTTYDMCRRCENGTKPK